MPEKVTIQKGTVQETLVFPLYGRSVARKMMPELFKDTEAEKIMAKMDYDFSAANMGKLPAYVYGTRQELLILGAKEYLEKYPDAIVVNLGCGLDTSFSFIDNGRCRYINLDLPDVIALREKLFDLKDRENNLAHDALDFGWMDKIGAGENDHVFIFSGGVLYYFKPEDVKALIDAMAMRFPGGCYLFDYENEKMVARSNSMVKKTGNKGAEMYYWVNNGKEEISAYSAAIESVEIINSLPKEYSKLPFVPKLMFKLELGKEMMAFAKVNFKK